MRPSRLPLLIAWLVIVGVVAYVGSNPRLLAPYASRLVSRHLLRIDSGGLRVSDFRLRAFEGLDLYGVSLTLPGRTGGMTLISADTVAVDFALTEALGAVPHLRRVTVRKPEIYSMAGSDTSAAARGTVDIRLPELRLDQVVVSDGFLEFSDAAGRLVESIPHLDWSGSLATGDEIRAVMRGVDVDWATHNSHLTELRGEVVVDSRGVAATSVTGRFNDQFVRVGGYRNWDKSLRLQVEGTNVSVAEVEDLIDMNIGFAATGNLVGSFESRGDSLWYEGVFDGELEGYRMSALEGKALVLADSEVRLTEMSGTINGAEFSGGGNFDITDPANVSFVLGGEVSRVDMAKGLIPGEEDLPLTDGSGRLRIEHTDYPLWTRVSGVLHDGRIETIPFDTCYVDVEAYADGVAFNQVEIRQGELHALLTGFADSTEAFAGRLSFNSEDLAALPAEWGWPALRGRANGEGQLRGPLADLGFDGDLVVYGFGLDPLTADRAAVGLKVDDVLGVPNFTGRAHGAGLVVGGVPLGNYRLVGAASAAEARVDSFVATLGDTAVTLRFAAGFTDSVTNLTVTELGVDLEGTTWRLDRPVPIGAGPGYFTIDDLQLASAHGAVSGSGYFKRGVRVSGGLSFSSFDLGLLNPFVDTEAPLTGYLTADVEAGGDPDSPTVAITGKLTEAPFALARIDSLGIVASYQGGTISISELDMLTDFGEVRGRGTVSHPGAAVADFWPEADLDLDLEFVEGDWAFLDQFAMPALDRLAGRFNGRVKVRGSSDDPIVRGEMSSAPFNVHWLHLDELTAEVQADSRSLVLGDMRGHKDDLNLSGRIEVPLVLDFLSEPVSPLDGPLYMQFEVPPGSNLAPLSRATNAFVTSSGTGEASVVIAGPASHPLYTGEVKLQDAGFVLRDLEEVYNGASCEGKFSGDTLTLTNIRGREGLRGSFAGEGSVTFNGLVVETFDLNLELDRFLLASIPDLRVVASSDNARMIGVSVGPDSVLVPKFLGHFTVLKGRYTGDFKEKAGAVDPLAGTVAPDWLADLSLHGDPRVAHIVNREMELALGGNLNLNRTEDGLQMRGTLDVNKGFLIAFNNKFEVQRGRLDFSRELGFDPRVDLDAQTEYRLRLAGSSNSIIEHIDVQVSGLMSKPVVRFSSERGYSTEAIERMLLGLEPQATPEGDSRALANSSISAGLNLLEREIAREFDLVDTVEIDQIVRRRETGDPGLDPLIAVGKYFGSDLYLKYAQGLRGTDDLDLLVEYQINRHLLLQTEVRRRLDENQGDPNYNLDLKYRFEY